MAAPYPLILVDGSSYLFRAYHAMPKLTNSRGEPTGALIGVLNMLRKLIETYRPDYLAVVFDASGKTFRNDLYADYKAHRPPMPEDLREQIAPLHTIIETMGLALLCVPGVEADDVIGTLATQAAAAGIRTLISTGDKDMAQLVDDRVHLINTMTDALLDAAGVEEKYGVPPARIVDYLSLMGDSVDNVPGVPKCGPKTAVKWLAAHGDLDGVIANAAVIKGKVGDNLRAALDQLPLSRQLTTIKCDVALPLGPTELVPGTPDRERLREWFERIESRKLLADLDRLDPTAPAPTAPETPQGAADYQVVLDRDGFLAWVERLRAAPLFAFDTETTALDYMRAEIVGVSFAIEPGAAAYVPLAHTCPGTPEQLDRDWVLDTLKPLLEDPERAKVGQNLKYDMSVLARHGITLRGIAHDTMLESYVLDSTAGRHDMDSLARRYLDCDTIAFEDIAGKGVKQLTFDQIPLDQAGPYAAEDAEVTLRLHRHLWPRLESEAGLAALYRDLEIPLVPILSRMERHGVRIDCDQLATHSHDLAVRIQALETQAHEVAGRPFNMGSPKQIGAILFDEQGLPVVAKTPKGAPSTSESVLEQLAAEGHELPRLILEHRGLAKLRSTYTDKLPQLVNPDSGRLHTSYHQAVAATGRLSSSDPNLQNIPIRTEEGRRIRRAFVAEPGNLLIAADYSQIELRIMAHLSGDERLLAAFASGQDIHRATAAEILGIAPEAVDAEQRRSAKAVNFGLIYGMSAFGLARQLGIGRAAAQDYVDRYFERYPGVHAFMERIRAQAHEDGHVETLFGRRLHLPEIASRNQNRRAAAERTAINAPMQGSAADIIKRAMITLDDWIERERPPARMIMQVHDELVFEVAADAVEAVGARIRAAMEQAAELRVPLVVDLGVGENWQAAH
ncbi:DNA polymerase I [Marichromatium purpuratum 984]|uniref:DNA polymerase I n=1 Tax=Marichromatium purpuratum 984 TaxID=765910 RepID=W0E5X0_MARPU|nr:DNA polymerase I [Marichromatium purpuratum]AHF04604.1 DNA polymerase I [Marichromatium purpuratum 984]